MFSIYLAMHRSIAGYNPYNLISLTIYYSKNFTTNKVLTIGHMPLFVVKSTVIKINSLAYEHLAIPVATFSPDYSADRSEVPFRCNTNNNLSKH